MLVESAHPDITALGLHEAPIAISDRETFTIGQVLVNRERLLLGEGATYQGMAREEARALGGLMMQMNKRRSPLKSPKVGLVEPVRPKDTVDYDIVIGTIPLLRSKAEGMADSIPASHSWSFRAYVQRSLFRIGGSKPDLLGVGIHGTVIDPATLNLAEHQTEDHYISLQGIENGLGNGHLPQPEVEAPDDLFYAAQLGLLRAARIQLGDKSAPSVIE